MKNPIVIFVIVALAALLGFGGYMFIKNSSVTDSMMKQNETMMPKEETLMTPTNAMMKDNGNAMESEKMMPEKMTEPRYVQYSKSSLDTVSDNRRVLFFYASWCPTCKPADVSFATNASKIPDDVTVIRVNYNDPDTDQEEKDLAKKYGITYQHTFVQIDSTGREISKWNGGEINELLSNIK